jgi:nucleobase:cation symporter-1, NCS1 family
MIHIAQRWTAYVLIVALILFSIALFVRTPLSPALLAWGKFHTVAFLAQFFAAASYQLSWSMYVSDYSRYLPRTVGISASFWWTYLGAAIGGAWTMLVGTVAAALYPNMELARALRSVADGIVPGVGKPLLLCFMIGLVTITSLNFYGASLTLLSVMDSFKPSRPTLAKRLATLLIAAIAATAIAIATSDDFVEQFGAFLAVLLYLFTPWTAINLVDFYWVRRGHYSVREIFNARGMYGRWNWRGLLAYGVGFVAMIPFFSTPLYSGPIAAALGGADIAMLVGLPVSAAVYLVACRSLDIEQDRRLARAADVGLD